MSQEIVPVPTQDLTRASLDKLPALVARAAYA